jgi:alpha-L-fucosidase
MTAGANARGGGGAGGAFGGSGGTMGGASSGAGGSAGGLPTGGVAGDPMPAGSGGEPAAGSAGAGQGGSPAGGSSGGGGIAGGAGTSSSGTAGSGGQGRPLEEVQREYIELRFGMFIHFGILTYTGEWAEPNLDIDLFNPTALDTGQWADAAVAAKMKYAVLTTRHHDGFALWNSAVSDFDVGSISWRNGQGDVVREYVDAFRQRGLPPGLYYSVWDATQGIGNTTSVTRAQIDYVKTQLTELLTNYGPIPILIFDGWSWKMGHKAVPYQEIRELVKSLQPDCLMLDHSHFMSPWDADVAAIEEPKGAFAPADNTYPATQGQKIVNGNDWFWAPSSAMENPMAVSDIVDDHLSLPMFHCQSVSCCRRPFL